MTPTQLKAIWAEAKALHATMPADDRPSREAVFIACASTATQTKHAYTPPTEIAPPDFEDRVRALQPQHATATAVYRAVTGCTNPTPAQARQCGHWLRNMGYTARKANGRVLFMLNH